MCIRHQDKGKDGSEELSGLLCIQYEATRRWPLQVCTKYTSLVLERHRDGAAAKRQRGEQALVQQLLPQIFAPEQPVTRVGGPWQLLGRLAPTRVNPTLDATSKVAKTYPTQA